MNNLLKDFLFQMLIFVIIISMIIFICFFIATSNLIFLFIGILLFLSFIYFIINN